MKRFYDILMNHAYALVVLLCTTPYAPSWIQKRYGSEWSLTYCFVILVISIVIFVFSYWWAKSDWLSDRPARMSALFFASLLGLIISLAAIFAIYGVWTIDIYLWWRNIPAMVLVGGTLGLSFIDLAFFRKK